MTTGVQDLSGPLEPAQRRITRPDGCGLHLLDWSAAHSPSKRGVLLLHGLGEHAGRYQHVARWFVARGWRVWAYDHRGHGLSDGRRGVIDEPDQLLTDALSLLEAFTDELHAAPLLLGHSMGGLLAAQMVVVNRARVRGLVLSSPALDPGLGAGQKLLTRMLTALAPRLAVGNGLDPAMVSHDPDVVRAYRDDPLVHDRVSAGLVNWMLRAGDMVRQQAPTLMADTLLLVAGSDRLVSAPASRRFAEQAPPGRVSLQWYDLLYHELFNEREPERSQVMADLQGWLEGR